MARRDPDLHYASASWQGHDRMVRLRHERQPLLRKARSRQPAGRHHLPRRTWTRRDRSRADRPILTAPCILRPMTPDGDSRREEIRATLNRLRRSPNESVPLRVAAARQPVAIRTRLRSTVKQEQQRQVVPRLKPRLEVRVRARYRRTQATVPSRQAVYLPPKERPS